VRRLAIGLGLARFRDIALTGGMSTRASAVLHPRPLRRLPAGDCA